MNEHRAVVTGGTGLIGGAVCLRLAKVGMTVGVGSRSLRKAEQWIGERPSRYQRRLVPIELDLADEVSIKSAFRRFHDLVGTPDILVGSASNREDLQVRFDALSHQAFTKLAAVDLAGHFLCARQLVADLDPGRPASIVFLSSIYANNAVDASLYPEGMTRTPIQYGVIKAGITAMTRELAGRWGESGIRVNAVIAGGVRSAERQPEEFAARYSRKTMLRRMGTAEEIAAAVAFLASTDSSYVTGECLVVDGGFSSW